MPCGWKTRGKRCGQPDVAIRDLGLSYGKLRIQPVCKLHAQQASRDDERKRDWPRD